MFSTYPDEWPGAGLLLLRTAVAGVLLIKGGFSMVDWHGHRFAAGAVALLAAGSGILILTGCFTRIGSFLVVLASVGCIFAWPPDPGLNLFESRLTAALVAVIASALVCLGPGAFSLDARLFGRQEIIFPETASDK